MMVLSLYLGIEETMTERTEKIRTVFVVNKTTFVVIYTTAMECIA